jgi:hypothetical protein
LWRALREVDTYLRGQSMRLINYAKRYRAGLRVGTSMTEGTANFLVNQRMNKAQQMRWSRRGAPTCCCRFGARSTTERSGPASANCSSRYPIRSSNHLWPLDPPTFWALPCHHGLCIRGMGHPSRPVLGPFLYGLPFDLLVWVVDLDPAMVLIVVVF